MKLFQERNTEFREQLQSLEQAITGADGLQVMLGRLDERIGIANTLADALVAAMEKK